MPTTALQIAYIDGPRLRRSLLAACEYAQLQRSELNRINVFPVPDGDTGTNLALTVRAIADHLRANRARTVSEVAHEAAQGAVLGARGNCGMMLSHFLLGFAEHVSSRDRITPAEFGSALDAGVERLYGSIEHPVEGTILTVMREAAVAARDAEDTDFVPLMRRVVEQARRTLARTPELLPVLKKAGVVDAGAKGFVSLLEGVHLLLQGVPVEAAPTTVEGPDAPAGVAAIEFPQEEEQYRYCTEALVRGSELPTQREVRDVLSRDGDSVIAIRSEDVLKIHVHTDEPEQVFDYLRSLGTLVTHKAEDMQAQHSTITRAGGHIELARRPIAVVTDSSADLSEEIVRAHGIHVIPVALVAGDRTYRDSVDLTATQFHEMLKDATAELPTTSQPSPADVLETFRRAAEEGEEVVAVLLGSSLSGTFHAAEAAADRFEDAPVHLVDTLAASLMQGLLVLKAAEMGEAGHTPAEIVEEVRRVRKTSGTLYTVTQFDRLIASGRVDRRKVLIPKLLGLRPILGLDQKGEVVGFGKAFGNRHARTVLLRVLREQIPADTENVRFGVMHVGVPQLVEPIAERIRGMFGRDVEILTAPATPAISTHLGIGAWGVAWMVED